MKLTFSVILSLLLLGCSDEVTNTYRTYDEAVTDNLFGRGWLPDIIPESSTNIETTNNLDINTSTGEFYFDQNHSDSFISLLEKQSNIDNGYIKYQYNEWIFEINIEKGHSKYVLK